MKKSDNPKPATLAVWAGEEGPFWQRSTQVPVVHSVFFGYEDMDEWLQIGRGKAAGCCTLKAPPTRLSKLSTSPVSRKKPMKPVLW